MMDLALLLLQQGTTGNPAPIGVFRFFAAFSFRTVRAAYITQSGRATILCPNTKLCTIACQKWGCHSSLHLKIIGSSY